MRTPVLCLLLVCTATALAQTPKPVHIPSAQDDLAWLNRYLDANAAGSRRVQVHSGNEIPFSGLSEHIGARIGVTLKDGRSRSGVLTSADAQKARMQVRLAAGEYAFEFARGDVQRITGGQR